MKIKNNEERWNYEAVFWITVLHVSLLVAIPFFTWKAFFVCILLLFTVSPIGVNLTYHRLLSHRAFKVPKWFEYILVTIGALSAQGPVLPWVAGHRYHHRFADQQKDIHTPNRGGFWGAHLFAILKHHEFYETQENWEKYVPDLNKDPYYQFLTKYNLYIAFIPLFFLYAAGGWSFVLWGGFVRVLLMLHFTWFVNSATHLWGYRNFETPDRSTNCWWVAILAAGEGWHNNHHAQPSSASHGMKWFEFDLTYCYIWIFKKLGLIHSVKMPNYEALQAQRKTNFSQKSLVRGY